MSEKESIHLLRLVRYLYRISHSKKVNKTNRLIIESVARDLYDKVFDITNSKELRRLMRSSMDREDCLKRLFNENMEQKEWRINDNTN